MSKHSPRQEEFVTLKFHHFSADSFLQQRLRLSRAINCDYRETPRFPQWCSRDARSERTIDSEFYDRRQAESTGLKDFGQVVAVSRASETEFN